MVIDTLLQQAELESKDTVNWGNYDQLYDWTWENGRPSLIPKNPMTAAGILLRDWTIAETLKKKGVKKVLDIGSDTGHFIAVLKHHGIDAVGIDANKKMCDFIQSKGQNTCYNLGIETLITLDLEGYDCITCMNITQAKWEDESLKDDLISWITKRASYAILSDFTHQDKKWHGLTKIHDFNLLPFYCSPLVVRVAKRLGIEHLVSYTSIQKLYKTKHQH